MIAWRCGSRPKGSDMPPKCTGTFCSSIESTAEVARPRATRFKRRRRAAGSATWLERADGRRAPPRAFAKQYKQVNWQTGSTSSGAADRRNRTEWLLRGWIRTSPPARLQGLFFSATALAAAALWSN